MTRDQIVAAARSYLGVRWRHQGRDKSGMDCVGLLIAVGRDCGVPVTDHTDYKRIPDGNQVRRIIFEETTPGSMQLIAPGSILLLKQMARPCHCGFVGKDEHGGLTLIHASINNGAVVEEPMSSHWPNVIAVREVPGVE